MKIAFVHSQLSLSGSVGQIFVLGIGAVVVVVVVMTVGAVVTVVLVVTSVVVERVGVVADVGMVNVTAVAVVNSSVGCGGAVGATVSINSLM